MKNPPPDGQGADPGSFLEHLYGSSGVGPDAWTAQPAVWTGRRAEVLAELFGRTVDPGLAELDGSGGIGVNVQSHDHMDGLGCL